MHNKFSLLSIKISAPTTSHSFADTLLGVAFSWGCIFWYSGQVEQYLTAFSISALIFTQYVDFHASILIFLIPRWFLCNWLNICICNWEGIIIHLPFMAMPSIMANACLMGQYFCISCPTSSFCVANPVWYISWTLAGVHLWLLLLVYLALMYTLAGPLLCW